MAHDEKTLEQIKALLESKSVDKKMHHDDATQRAEELGNAYRVLTETHSFKPGELVTWKPGMRNKKKPLYGEPAIVIEVLDEPAFSDEDESGSAYFREPLDVIVGFLDEETLVLFHYDKRRFEPFKG